MRGKRVLDYGCGHGMASVILARRGATVIAFDLSLGYLHEVQRRAEANDVTIMTVQADGERLPFANNTFDGLWGNAVLHHLDIDKAGHEIARVLKPDGIAVFCEPWGGNPLLNWARQKLQYCGKERTPDETPLRQVDVTRLRQIFPHVGLRGHQLLSMVSRVIHAHGVVQFLRGCDRVVLKTMPFLQRFCRYMVITLKG
ncbi:MAG: class I SAM-dependent methyltransferase [Gemmataceae bacterium]